MPPESNPTTIARGFSESRRCRYRALREKLVIGAGTLTVETGNGTTVIEVRNGVALQIWEEEVDITGMVYASDCELWPVGRTVNQRDLSLLRLGTVLILVSTKPVVSTPTSTM